MNRFYLSSILVIAFVAAATVAHALSPIHTWSQNFGGLDWDRGYSVTTDNGGNVIVTGFFTQTVDFGGGALVSAGANDVFLAKYDANGVHQWSNRYGASGLDIGLGVAVDASGNIFLTGPFTGTVDFGGGNITSAGGEDVFIAKFDANGVHQWSQGFGSTSFDRGFSIAVDGLGNILVTGYFSATVDFGGGNLTSAGGLDIFLAKYDTDGVHQWSQRFGGTGSDYGRGGAGGGLGNVYLTGDFQGAADFGGGNLVSVGNSDIVVAKYDASGTHQWSHSYGSSSYDNGHGVAVDGSGGVFATGSFQGTVDFGGGSLVSAGALDVYLVKYDANGAHLWSQRFGGTGYDGGNSVAVDGTGNILTTGYFQGTIDFGGGGLVSAGGYEAFLAKHTGGGAHLWSQRFGDTGNDEGYGVSTDAQGNVIATGYFKGTVDFGGGGLASAGDDDIFVAKYDAHTVEPAISRITDIGNDQGGEVLIEFARSWHDDPGSATVIEAYEAYRRIDEPPASTAVRRGPTGLSRRELTAEGWTQVGTVAAHGESGYSVVAPTIGDSTTAEGQYYSVFYIRAATGDPYTFFDSPPDSGYSLDNLSPGVPLNFVFNAGVLTWDESNAEDFDYFSVYGSDVDNFAAAAVLDHTVTPTMDVSASPYRYYYVTATDFSGNEGAPSSLDAASSVGGTPQTYVLAVSSFPNPFNPSTTISYTVPARGRVTVAVYDVGGARVRTLVDDEERAAGPYRIQWSGRTDSGIVVASGVYFARIRHDGTVRTTKIVMLK